MARWKHPIFFCLLLATAGLMLLFLLPARDRHSSSAGAACRSNLRSLAVALDNYAQEHQGHYPQGLAQLVPHYLSYIPTCPAAHIDTYSVSYRSSARPDCYAVFCNGQCHQEEGLAANLPGLSSELGLISQPPRTTHQLVYCQSRLDRVAKEIERFRSREKRLPKALSELGEGNLDLSYSVRNKTEFRLSCSGLNHAYEGLQAGEPAFDSRGGLVACRIPPELPSASAVEGERPSLRSNREDSAPPLFLGIPAFAFILFVLWPFETQNRREPVSDWRLLTPARRNKD